VTTTSRICYSGRVFAGHPLNTHITQTGDDVTSRFELPRLHGHRIGQVLGVRRPYAALVYGADAYWYFTEYL
jgi:hypothetical protein